MTCEICAKIAKLKKEVEQYDNVYWTDVITPRTEQMKQLTDFMKFKNKKHTRIGDTVYYEDITRGVSEKIPKCPECKEGTPGEIQTDFPGYYTDGVRATKHRHIHICPRCGWKSEKQNGEV